MRDYIQFIFNQVNLSRKQIYIILIVAGLILSLIGAIWYTSWVSSSRQTQVATLQADSQTNSQADLQKQLPISKLGLTQGQKSGINQTLDTIKTGLSNAASGISSTNTTVNNNTSGDAEGEEEILPAFPDVSLADVQAYVPRKLQTGQYVLRVPASKITNPPFINSIDTSLPSAVGIFNSPYAIFIWENGKLHLPPENVIDMYDFQVGSQIKWFYATKNTAGDFKLQISNPNFQNPQTLATFNEMSINSISPNQSLSPIFRVNATTISEDNPAQTFLFTLNLQSIVSGQGEANIVLDKTEIIDDGE